MTMSFCWMRKILAGRPDANMPALLTRMCQVAEPWAGQYSAWSRLACTWRGFAQTLSVPPPGGLDSGVFCLNIFLTAARGAHADSREPTDSLSQYQPNEATNG